MTKTATFRLLVIIYICFFPILIVATFLDASLLPPELAEWVNQNHEAEFDVAEVVGLLFSLCALGFVIASVIGLLRLKKWGARCLLAAAVAGGFVGPLLGPHVESGLLYTCEYTCNVLFGVILGMAFFSDVLAPAPAAHVE